MPDGVNVTTVKFLVMQGFQKSWRGGMGHGRKGTGRALQEQVRCEMKSCSENGWSGGCLEGCWRKG